MASAAAGAHKRPRNADTQPSVLGDPEDPWSYHKETVPADVPVRLLPQLVQLVNSEDPKDQLQGTLLIRKLLCVLDNPPIDQVVESQVVPRLVSFLIHDDFVDLQLEATCAVTNIVSGAPAHMSCVLEKDAVPLIRLLSSPSEALREQATAALGAIAGDSATCRDDIIAQGVMAPLLQCITTPAHNVSVLRNGVWAVSNLCRSKPSPDLGTVCQALPILVPLLAHDDEDVAANVCWALAHISDGPPAYIERVLNTGALPQIIRLLTSDHVSQQTPALRVVRSMAAGDHEQAQLLVTSGVLPPFHDLLQHPDWKIKKEACWALSAIIRGPPEQVQAVVDAQLFPVVLQGIGAVEYEVKKEAILCVANLAVSGTPEQIRYVVEELNVFGVLVPCFRLGDAELLKAALNCVRHLLQAGEDEKHSHLGKNPYAQKIIDNGGHTYLKNLDRHNDNDVYFAAVTIFDDFFEPPDFYACVKRDSDSPEVYDSPPQPDSQPAPPPAPGGESEIPTSLATDSAIQAAITAGIKETTASLQAEVLALRRQLVTVEEQLSVAQDAAMQLSMRLDQI